MISPSQRVVQSAGSFSPQLNYDESRPHTTSVVQSKSNNVFWRDFRFNVKKRKITLQRLREAALEASTSLRTLKKSLVDLRLDTLSLVEDALELEYRTHIAEDSSANKRTTLSRKLPPIVNAKVLEEKEDVLALSEIIYDVDDLFTIPNIRVMLPMNFPNIRNPFMLGKTIDELAALIPPHPESGNVDEELKVLELLRYKRTARALLRAESQVLNRLPVSLFDLERLLSRMADDSNIEKLIRCVGALIDNDRVQNTADMQPNLSCLNSPIFQIEGYDFLKKLNNFQGAFPMRVDVQIIVRQYLLGCVFEYLVDPVSQFLLEWTSIVLGSSKLTSANSIEGSIEQVKPSILTTLTSQYNNSIQESLPEDTTPFKQPFAIARMDDDLVSEVNSMKFGKTHENIQPIISSRKKRVFIRTPPQHLETQNENISGEYQTHATISDSTKASVHKPVGKRLRKIMNEQSKSLENASEITNVTNKKIRSEVEKAIRELALYNKPTNDEENNNGSRTVENINSIRYELTKMQQELFRKQVLDSRYYPSSIDGISQVQRGLTVPGVNSFTPFNLNKNVSNKKFANEKNLSDDDPLQAVELGTKNSSILHQGEIIPVSLSIVIHRDTSWLSCSASIQYDISVKHGFQEESRSFYFSEADKVPFILCYLEISPLVFSKLTDYTSIELFNCKTDLRKRILQNLFDQLENVLRLQPMAVGKVQHSVELTLYQQKLVEDNLLLDFSINRNLQCTGLLFACTILAGVLGSTNIGANMTPKNVGPIELFLHDNELEILLITQHGLFMSAKQRWSSMKTVAQWLAGRIRIKKISGISQLSTFPRKSSDIDELPSSNPEIIANTSAFMLEINVNRCIDLSSFMIDNWKSRNLPRLLGLECSLTAFQDFEVLQLNINLTVPSKVAYKKLCDDNSQASKHSQDLIDLENYIEDDEYEYDEGIPAVVELSYRLTRIELLTFGNLEYVENKKVVLSQKSTTTLSKSEKNGDHPDQLIWNILQRLKVIFQGSKSDPYRTDMSALSASNWSLNYDRLLIRDVKTISKMILLVKVSAVGNELLLEAEPVETANNIKLESKIISESEVAEFVYGEGWSNSLVEYSKRQELIVLLLDKLKIVTENNHSRLELQNYVENRMITIMKTAVGCELEREIGNVEINSYHTLNDLRIILKHEFDVDELPVQYRFLYKGTICSLRQESFRRAWECLPICWIIPKQVIQTEIGIETDDIVQKRQRTVPKKDNAFSKFNRSQRRVPGKHIPLPIPTLCVVEEGNFRVFLLHESKEFFVAGDIIRLGNVRSRDYIVTAIESSDKKAPPCTKVIEIEPEYDLIREPDFNAPITNNFHFPSKNAGLITTALNQTIRILPTKEEFGFHYELSNDTAIKYGASPLSGHHANVETTNTKLDNDDGGDDDDDSTLTIETTNSRTKKTDRSKHKALGTRVFTDCWIWKCVAAKEDPRPKWRQLYDDGEVAYSYEFGNSEEFFEHFRTRATYSYLEVLCTDARCNRLTTGVQRVQEMKSIQLEYYLKLIYDKMTDWTPAYKRGIERTKFIKLIRDVTAFPDLKRPARIAQLDMLFQKLVKSSYGIVQKYLTYPGFCELVKEVALLRFPPRKKENSGVELDENQSQKSNENKASKKKVDSGIAVVKVDVGTSDDASAMTDDLSTIVSEQDLPIANKKIKKQPSKRSSTEDEFNKLSNNVDSAYIQQIYEKFILDYLMVYPSWYDIVWREAKLMAMKKESLKYCAATRIIAVFRGYYQHKKYIFIIHQIICLQSHVRKKLHSRHVRNIINMLWEDYLFRIRYHQSIKIQAIIRRFLKRCWYEHVLEQIKKQQVLLCKARRQKYKKNLESVKKRLIYAEVQKMNGILVLIRVYRKDPRNYTKDFGIIIEAYLPSCQAIYKFPLEDAELRSYMAMLLEKDTVTVGEILLKQNIRNLISCRLIVHKSSQKHAVPIIIFSKHALGQRGIKSITRAKRIQGELFVCKIFETVEELVVQLYHRHTCKIFTCKIETEELRKWIIDDFSLQVSRETFQKQKAESMRKEAGLSDGNTADKANDVTFPGADEMTVVEEPFILHPDNKNYYYAWILNHLVIDTRKGKFQVVFANQLEKSRKLEMIIKIQSQWRRALVRPLIIQKLDKLMVKVKSEPHDMSHIYYLNRFTGASSWDKPKLLGIYDLLTEPSRRWVPIHYESNGVPCVYNVNPFTGKYTYMVPDQAARIIQCLVRNHLLKAILMPRDQFSKAAKIFMSASKLYHQYNEGETRRLAHVINYALVTHIVELEEQKAKDIYAEAVELSEANPLVTRSYAFYLMSTCEPPIGLNRERAQILLGDAERRDPEIAKFQLAYSLYQFACLRQPTHPSTLVNLALVQCVLFNKNYTGEKLLRRALALAPFEERVMELWKFLKDRFPERHILYNPMSRIHKSQVGIKGKKRVIHGRQVIENNQWAGWCYVEDDIYQVSKIHKGVSYWYNPADGSERTGMPSFEEEWIIRKARSYFQVEEYGLEQYYDPLTADYFQYHPLTNSYS